MSLRSPASAPSRSRLTLARPFIVLAGVAAIASLAACSAPPDKPSPVANAVANTSAALRADDDMKTVLDAFAALDP